MSAYERHRLQPNLRLVSGILAGICFLGGLWNCWRFCYAPDTDEISYLNIGEAFLRGDGSHFLNSTWGPLYGVVSSVWLRVMPSAYPREALKVLNLCVLLLILWGAMAISSRMVRAGGTGISVFFTFATL